jgi:hypothetical protein
MASYRISCVYLVNLEIFNRSCSAEYHCEDYQYILYSILLLLSFSQVLTFSHIPFSLRLDQVPHSYFLNTRIRHDTLCLSLQPTSLHDEGFQGRRLHKNRKSWQIEGGLHFFLCVVFYVYHSPFKTESGCYQTFPSYRSACTGASIS